MPRRVVPIFVPELEAASSRNPSSSRCSDRISAVFSAISAIRRHFDTLSLSFAPLRRRKRAVEDDAIADDGQFALAHDARRQTATACRPCRRRPACGRHCDRPETHHDIGTLRHQSTILPLPSSPHCEPTTTTLAMFLFP